MSFWYGLPFEAVATMPLTAIEAYLERLPARMAEWKMMMADPIALPHMKKRDAQKMMNNWNRAMNENAPVQPASPAALMMIGIGVKFEH